MLFPTCPDSCDLLSFLDMKRYSLPRSEILLIVHQICWAIDHLHQLNIVHRDIKLENFLINKKTLQVVLIDFDLAQKVSTVEPKFCGSVNYVSPELVETYFFARSVTDCLDLKKCDVWALGVVIFTLVTGRFPFGGDTVFETFESIKNSHRSLAALETFPSERRFFNGLLQKILCRDLSKRYSIDNVLEQLGRISS